MKSMVKRVLQKLGIRIFREPYAQALEHNFNRANSRSSSEFKINQREFSALFWRSLLETFRDALEPLERNSKKESPNFEALRKNSQYDTGSIPDDSSILLSIICMHFKPSVVAEVGTFIGRSTHAIFRASKSDFGNYSCEIYTCDYSNDINLHFADDSVIQYQLASSVDMFQSLLDLEIKPDLYYFDGRLGDQDLALIGKMNFLNSVIVLDDYEGIEKGVQNASLIESKYPQIFVTAYPPEAELLKTFGLRPKTSLAVMIPKSLIRFSKQ